MTPSRCPEVLGGPSKTTDPSPDDEEPAATQTCAKKPASYELNLPPWLDLIMAVDCSWVDQPEDA